ncbi:MAG: LLM class flavin-dependent oxidoreductase, partial [Pyrinomonadaceae bacterium]
FSIEDGLPDLETKTDFCRQAEEAGIDSLLTDFGYGKPDPMLVAAILGHRTEKIKFILAYRSGLFSPTMFVQQLNTLSALINGRFSLNIVAGYSPEEQRAYGDFLSHDERYERTEEFLGICRSFWRRDGEVNFHGKHYRIEKGSLKTPYVSDDRTFPEIFIGGGSEQAHRLALSQGTCWMRLADAPETMRESVAPVLAQGVEVGLRMAVISRPTREEALSTVQAMAEGVDKGREFVKTSVSKMDSVSFKAIYEKGKEEWLTPCLWAGAVHMYGPAAITLVGSAEEVASAFMDYKRLGIWQFILSGWPKLAEMVNFGRTVLPIIREMERETAVCA